MSLNLHTFAVVVALLAASVEGSPCASTNWCFFCTSCKTCFAGSWLSHNGVNKCHNVGAGYYSPGGTTGYPGIAQATCGPGQYTTVQPNTNQNRGCSACPAGKTSQSSNAASCTEINGCVYPTQNKCQAQDPGATCQDVKSFRFKADTEKAGKANMEGMLEHNKKHTRTRTAVAKKQAAHLRTDAKFFGLGTNPTDPECKWDYLKVKCMPPKCIYKFMWGDMNLDTSCRLRPGGVAYVPTAAAPTAPLGIPYKCTCSAGYVATAFSCVNLDGCTGNTCASKDDKAATCVDAAPPATGFSCTCSEGYNDDGGICKRTDFCGAGVVSVCGLHGDSAAICMNKPLPESGNTCSCTEGFNSTGVNATTVCKDTDGCKNAPCKTGGDKQAVCNDEVAPKTGHTCTCTIGYEASGTTCIDTPGCSVKNNKCSSRGDIKATCYDVAAPGTGNTCDCSPGRIEQNGICTDMDGCDKNQCADGGDTKATCKDAVAPATGFACVCTRGYSNEGGICKPIDSCSDSCGADEGAICKDLAPPAIGNTCGCTKGYNESCAKEEPVKDACVDNEWGGATLDGEGNKISGDPWTCNTYTQKNWCAGGKEGPAWKSSWKWGTSEDGSTGQKECCACGGGNKTLTPKEDPEAKDDKTCTCLDTDGCKGAPCAAGGDDAALCKDEVAPKTGHTCSCNMGYAAMNGTCKDIDGCKDKPCSGKDTGATCADVAAPAPGYAHVCTCSSGFHAQKGSCTDIDGCAKNTCDTAGDTASKCIDVPPPATGFTCGCSAGYREAGGVCVDIDDCAASPCHKGGNEKAKCTDLKAPARGNTCACTAGYQSIDGGADGIKTCANINACKAPAAGAANSARFSAVGIPGDEKCISSGDKFADCVDKKPPSSSFTCKCSPHFHFDRASMSCMEDLCMAPLVKRGAYGGNSCADGACPMIGFNKTVDATKIVCDEGYIRTGMTEFKCECGGNRETCTTLSNACMPKGQKGPVPDGKNCATFNHDQSKCCKAGAGKQCAFASDTTCKKKGKVPDGENKCSNPGMETRAPEEPEMEMEMEMPPAEEPHALLMGGTAASLPPGTRG